MADGESKTAKSVGSNKPGRRYAAFLSYSHADEKIASWLHHRLEIYSIPKTLAHGRNKSVLGQVFRDRVELAATHDLGGEIRKALEASDALIVLCSPQSAESRYVEEEIRFFKHLGRGRQIFAVIVSGEPHAAVKPGRRASEECFPRALLYRVSDEGTLSSEPEATEPIAADFRDLKDGRENGSLKIIAALLGVGLDDLIQREKQAELGRRRRAQFVAAAMGVLALGAAGGGGTAWWLQGIAESSAQRARDTLHRQYTLRAWEKVREGESLVAMRYALAGLTLAPANSQEYEAVLGRAMYDTGEPGALLQHSDITNKASFSPDGKRIVTASRDGTVKVWDAADDRLLITFSGYGGSVESASFSPDGQRIVLAAGGFVRVLDATNGTILTTIKADYVSDVSFSPDGRRIVTVGGSPGVWDAADGRFIAALYADGYGASTASFSRDGRRILTVCVNGSVKVWDAADGRLVTSVGGGSESETARSASFSPDGRSFITGGSNTKVWDATDGRLLTTLNTGEVWRASYSPDGRRILTAGGYARVWDAADGSLLASLSGFESDASFSPDGRRILTVGSNARVWDAADGRLLATIHGAELSPLSTASFSSDGRFIFTLGGTVRVWDAAGDHMPVPFRGNVGLVQTGRYTEHGRRTLSTSDDSLFVRDVDGSLLATLDGQGSRFTSAKFSPDGRLVVTASTDKTAKVWDAADGRLLVSLNGHIDVVSDASFSLDGRRIATASSDGTVKVWDAVDGRLLVTLAGNGGKVLAVSFSSDGQSLIATNEDNTSRAWDVRRLTQGISALADDACRNHLGSAERRFRQAEIDADPLLQDEWSANRDVCEGVNDVGPYWSQHDK